MLSLLLLRQLTAERKLLARVADLDKASAADLAAVDDELALLTQRVTEMTARLEVENRESEVCQSLRVSED